MLDWYHFLPTEAKYSMLHAWFDDFLGMSAGEGFPSMHDRLLDHYSAERIGVARWQAIQRVVGCLPDDCEPVLWKRDLMTWFRYRLSNPMMCDAD